MTSPNPRPNEPQANVTKGAHSPSVPPPAFHEAPVTCSLASRENAPPARRLVNPLGVAAMVLGVMATLFAVAATRMAWQPPAPGNRPGELAAGLIAGVGFLIVVFALLIVTAVLATVGTCLGAFGLVRPPRWQGLAGAALSLGGPLLCYLVFLWCR